MQKTSDIIWQDTQHQVLFELIDRIKEVPFDPDIFVRLKLYAEHHFILEETYMAELNYPLARDDCRNRGVTTEILAKA